jgi:hypothetical protein
VAVVAALALREQRGILAVVVVEGDAVNRPG